MYKEGSTVSQVNVLYQEDLSRAADCDVVLMKCRKEANVYLIFAAVLN